MDLKNLILSISKTIKDLGNGLLTYENAKENFSELQDIYNKLAFQENDTEKKNSARYICYSHNIDNFSIFSGIYTIKNEKPEMLTYFGDNSINSKVLNLLQNHASRIDLSRISLIRPEQSDSIPQDIHISRILFDSEDNYIFLAVSSSQFFSQNKFRFYGDFFDDLISTSIGSRNPKSINFYNGITGQIKKYISENINNEFIVSARIYFFKMLDNNFFHMGIHTLMEISNIVVENLNSSVPDGSTIITPSVKEYIVLSPMRRVEDPDDKGTLIKPEFFYKDLALTYKTIHLVLDSNESIYRFLEEVYKFQSYIQTGEAAG